LIVGSRGFMIRDGKYSGPFDEIFRSEEIRAVKTPIRAPKERDLQALRPHDPLRVPRLAADPQSAPS
jgi:hypothetical protein